MDVLNEILDAHNINEKFENAKKMDKENRIFKSENYVIKIYYPKKYNFYYNELKVYQALKGKDYLPDLYYWGENETYKYIVISKLNGKSLFDCWEEYSSHQHLDLISQIAKIIKDINNIEQQKFNFKTDFSKKFEIAKTSLDYSEKSIKLINYLFENSINYLGDNELCQLIHIDVHFYNFFVEKGKVFAYDFENLTAAPLDYQLLRWYRMWMYPQSFVYPKDSLSQTQINSYRMIMPELINNYPELLINQNSTERVKLYGLLYLLEEAKRCQLDEPTVKKYIKENIAVSLRG